VSERQCSGSQVYLGGGDVGEQYYLSGNTSGAELAKYEEKVRFYLSNMVSRAALDLAEQGVMLRNMAGSERAKLCAEYAVVFLQELERAMERMGDDGATSLWEPVSNMIREHVQRKYGHQPW